MRDTTQKRTSCFERRFPEEIWTARKIGCPTVLQVGLFGYDGRIRSHNPKLNGGGTVSQVFIDCPKTGKPIYVGLNMEWAQLESLDPDSINRDVPNCPHCGQKHRFENNDLYLRADGAG